MPQPLPAQMDSGPGDHATVRSHTLVSIPTTCAIAWSTTH